MTVTERFLRYIQVETTSDEASATCPSTPGQWDLARLLVDELQALGVKDAHVDEHGYVYGTIPAKGSNTRRIGLIAHMDTSDAVKGPTHPQMVKSYDGGPITLKNGTVIDGFDFLPSLKGQDLIVTDGTSVLGADDKAGVAEIMELAERLMLPDAPDHPRICIAFTPDEEIGQGVDHFELPLFGADYAYTVDGGALGEIEYDNFNAAACHIEIQGISYHPGDAKGRMKNACLVAARLIQLLPDAETPAHTEGREGFYHLTSFQGDVEHAEVNYIIRDHDLKCFQARKERIRTIVSFLNSEYGEGTVCVDIKDSYFNMLEIIQQNMDIVERAQKAFEANGIQPVSRPIRGGTDGARLSFMGLPCPNLSTGGYNFHSRKELIPSHALEAMTDVLYSLATM